jgi:hypothetical protein
MTADPVRGRVRLHRYATTAGIALLACGCGGGTQDSATLLWRDLQIHVESRGYGAVPEMKELLVYINKGSTLPAWNCRVEIRTSDEDPWKQAIEDGYVGVYRRAAKVDDRDHSRVQVRIRAEGDETVLIFPLTRKPAPPASGSAS